MSLVIDWPKDVGQTPRQAPKAAASPAPGAQAKASREILSDSRFWLINIAVGLYTAAGVTMSSHGPAMAVAKGAELTAASTLLSAMGAGTLFGAFAFGWLMDRIGPFRALVVAIAMTASLWFVLAVAPSVPVMALAAFFVGVAVGPTAALQSACLNEVFGAASFGRAIGYAFFIKLPFLVGPAPIAGRLYDVLGNYRMVCLITAAVETVGAFMAIALLVVHHRKTASGKVAAGVQPAE
jgi:MFS family permease